MSKIFKSVKNLKILIVDKHFERTPADNKFLKYRYIDYALKTYGQQSFDYICFVQSNLRCEKHVLLSDIAKSDFDIACVKHIYHDVYKYCFNDMYGNNSDTTVDLNSFNTEKYTYCFTGHVIWTQDEFSKMFKTIDEMMKIDFERHVFAEWHDETYFNFYINKLKSMNDVIVLDYDYLMPIEFAKNRNAKIVAIKKKNKNDSAPCFCSIMIEKIVFQNVCHIQSFSKFQFSSFEFCSLSDFCRQQHFF